MFSGLLKSDDPRHHTLIEDALAFLTGTVLVSCGLAFFQGGHLVTGGVVGLGVLVHYWTGWPFPITVFALNLPFYALALWGMGLAFTIRTFIVISLLSLESHYLPEVYNLTVQYVPLAPVLGGMLIGIGILALIRHKASLGGLGIVAFLLQDRLGWRAGNVQLACDGMIGLAALTVLSPYEVGLSVVGSAVMNVILTLYHKPGRYMGV